ncbi:Trichothecene 3-O-acetyltransferase [Fusarium oxysporum f. sp. rapae]|uniref:Trichothecene 3-O-acetyltransferase n=1 Tax=Fusarium oxysporum f. sp. rapae TaxID=485398 RepID=A0A8J5NE01_FUSOX|nr:Trichothecene 3-O-acetyltransferase [Fusarium oxysporum f. sp. rapae]KAG7404081.1 Trichothecene 3-O-acetyltransferase [Fusarium oxysporum f. sp. rapae]
MPKQHVYHLHPLGWENDPEEERFKVTTLDYLTVCSYNNYALFFKLEDSEKERAAEILKAGLERTLAQARHYCGTIEKDPGGGHSFTKKRDSTVRFFVQWLDAPEDADKYPSFEDLEKTNFSAVTLGDLEQWSVPPMTYGEKPEAHPDNNPVVSAFKANFIRGGLVFNIHHHHYTNDVMGWAGFVHQLAENCYAAVNGTKHPTWDPLNLDVSRLIKQEPPEDQKIDGPAPPERHPAHQVGVSLLFHLPKSKAAELKAKATPTDGTWISTYDAFSAFIWRNLTRIRAPVFNPDPKSTLYWCEAIDMRRRMHSPKVPPRIQHNVMFAVTSPTAPVTEPTVAQIMSEWSLSELASYIRRLTNSVTQENLDKTLEMVATIRDKTSLNTRVDAQPPLSILQTDHRDANITSADFGFAKPATYRHLLDRITEGVIIVYPPRDPSPESDEGCEFAIFYEKRLAQDLINDDEWSEYFEYRGVDAEDASEAKKANGTNGTNGVNGTNGTNGVNGSS